MMITLSSKAKEKDSKRVKRGKPHAAESPGRMEELLQAYFRIAKRSSWPIFSDRSLTGKTANSTTLTLAFSLIPKGKKCWIGKCHTDTTLF